MLLLSSQGTTVTVVLQMLVLIDLRETRRWFGPNMCKELCEDTLGCSEYLFSSCHLSCRIQNRASLSHGATTHVNNKQTDTRVLASLTRTCAKYSRIFYSRAGTLSCGTSVNTVSAGEHRVAHAILPRLLAIEYMSPTEQPFYKFHMDNKSVAVYPNLTSKKVKATGYLGALRRVILSLSDPYGLSYFTLGDSTVEKMKSNIVCSAMSVDVTRNLLVLAIGLPWSAMYTMKPDGDGYKLLFNISQPPGDRYDFPTALAMDLERDFVYMCLRNKILSADLNGKIRNVLFQGSSLQSIDFDPIGDVVYIGRRRDVLRISLRTNNILKIASFKTSVFSLLYYDNHIYASLYYLESLVTASVQNKKQEFHILTTKRNPKPIILCRIV